MLIIMAHNNSVMSNIQERQTNIHTVVELECVSSSYMLCTSVLDERNLLPECCTIQHGAVVIIALSNYFFSLVRKD